MSGIYESPIKIIQTDMETQIENGVYKAIQRVGIDVNKEELVNALQYDRNQYAKGYNDAVEEFREYLKTVSPCEMPQELWNMGVDNTCDRLKVR